jgi:hypothetical protein
MGPFHDLYAGLLAQGMKPEMARLTLARKISAITLTCGSKEERFRRRTTEDASSLSIE